ncbi:MAG TPA: DUF5677 domain-containing protein [Candidatus Acidoferrales bacterium]|jgi:hypothetical protein|nr:DUF5677 domain-containing protein [Candidatus Acidoferrales bacterium]
MDELKTSEFWARHGIPVPRAASLAEPAVVALDKAHQIFSSSFDGAPEPKETSGMVRCALENLSNRLYEQAAGMLVCLGTGSAAAAETVARTVIEGAMNLQFIASGNHEAKLFAFFYQYIQEHDRKLRDWQQLENSRLQTPGRTEILAAIAARLKAHQLVSDFVKGLGKGFGYDQPATVAQYWPGSLYKRCEQMDKTGDYLTSYHRLSASSHINAEETIRWLIGIHQSAVGPDSEIQLKLSIETVSFSAMMTRIAVVHYIEANIVASQALDAKCDQAMVQEIMAKLYKSIVDIASAAGSPN